MLKVKLVLALAATLAAGQVKPPAVLPPAAQTGNR
jgi:predicted small lipoprotein YifL